MTDKARILEAIQGLSDPEAAKVADFIDSLKNPEPKPGSVDAVRRALGAWWMSPDETRRFLGEIEEMHRNEDPERALPPQY